MLDVLIVGAGPAGSVAATVLARAGVRVRIVDRATFPRDKLCGDTVNPGTLARLRHLQMAELIERDGLRIDGMLVSGEARPLPRDGCQARAVEEAAQPAAPLIIDGTYPNGLSGRAISRSDLDWLLVRQAIDAGAEFDAGVVVRSPLLDETRRGNRVEGVVLHEKVARGSLRARVTIAADGRRSTLASALGLVSPSSRPRRWAIGGYFESARSAGALGEMHIRRGRYIGVAPLPGGLTNVCVVGPTSGSREGLEALGDFRNPTALLERELRRDPQLRDRFAGARLVRPPIVLGPLAVDVAARGIDGVILAGDAAGFIDPMTGDGMRFAVRGGELAAAAALEALEHGWTGVHDRLGRARRREFASKWRFNRALRLLVTSPLAVGLAAAGARVSPRLVRHIIARAGDCDVTTDTSLMTTASALAD